MMMMIMVELIKAGTRLYHQYDDDDYGGVEQGWYQTVAPICLVMMYMVELIKAGTRL